MNARQGKKSASLGPYLLKGLIAVLVLTGAYYFYFSKMNAGLKGKKEAQQTQPASPPKFGRVNGILFSEDKPSAVIDKDIVYEGQTIHDVKIVKVHKDKVEFEKAGNRWQQKLKEEPNILWVSVPSEQEKE